MQNLYWQCAYLGIEVECLIEIVGYRNFSFEQQTLSCYVLSLWLNGGTHGNFPAASGNFHLPMQESQV